MPNGDPKLVQVGEDLGYTALTPEELAIRTGAGTLEGREVTAEEVSAEAQRRVTEERYGDAYNQAITFMEGGASGLTFGATDLLFGGEESRYRAEVNPFLRGAGEFAGQLAPALLSGGAGTAGALARLTPAGRLAAITTRMATGGKTLAVRVVRGAAAGALDGAAAGAGNYIARQSLSEDPEFSAEGLLASAGMGSVFGGAAGGLLGAVTGRAPRIAEEVEDVALPLKGARPKIAETRGKQMVKMVDVVQAARKIDDKLLPEARREFADTLGKATRRSIDKEIDGAFAGIDDVAQRLEASAGAREAGEQYLDSMDALRQWGDDYFSALETKAAPEVLERIEGDGIVAMATVDDAARRFEATLPPPSASGLHPPMGAVSLPVPSATVRRGGGLFDAATNVLGAAEMAQDLGLPVPSLSGIPGIGPLMSAFVKFKALGRAAEGVGLIPRTMATGAAERVGQIRTRLGSMVARLAGRAAPGAMRLGRTAVKVAAPIPAAQALEMIHAAPDSAMLAKEAARVAQAAGSGVSTSAATAAGRAMAYLQDKAPKSPLEGTPWGKEWTPSEQESRDWERRWNSVQDPMSALDAIFSGPWSAIEAEAFRTVYPGFWRTVQQDLLANHAAVVANTPPALAQSIGDAFDIPLVISQIPQYSALPPSRSSGLYPMDPRFGQPTAATTAPIVTQDEVKKS